MPSGAVFMKQPGFATAGLGEELAVLSLASGTYLAFNSTGAHLWRLLDQPHTLAALVEEMSAEFDVDRDRCQNEVLALLHRLLQTDMIRCDV